MTDAVRAALAELVACHTESAVWSMSMMSNRAEFDAMIDRSQKRLEAAVAAARSALSEQPAAQTLSQQLAAAGFTRRPSLWAMQAREALELIAAPCRPDGSWNRDREACRQLAVEALGRYDDAQPVESKGESAPSVRVPLTDGQILSCVRAIGTRVPMGLTRDRGPYEVTEPTWFLTQLVRAVIAEYERANGVEGA